MKYGWAWLLVALSASTAQAGVLKGQVTDGAGKRVPGAIVNFTDAHGTSVAVYTNDKGAYEARLGLKGTGSMLVRKRYFEDLTRAVELGDSQTLDIKLLALTDPRKMSDDSPSLSHFSRIKFDDGVFSRENFSRDCLTCHSLGNAFTRGVRSAEQWQPTVERMHGYVRQGDKQLAADRAKLLADAFDGKLITSHSEIPYDADLATATSARARLLAESERLAALFARHELTPQGGCSLFQWIATERAAGLHERLAWGGILTRLFTDPPGLRFGLPGTESAWARLEAALSEATGR